MSDTSDYYADLISDTMFRPKDENGTSCLEFRYALHGNHPGTFEVEVTYFDDGGQQHGGSITQFKRSGSQVCHMATSVAITTGNNSL